MPSERIQRQIDRLLDEAEAALGREDWEAVASCVRRVIALDPENQDARAYLAAAERSLGITGSSAAAPQSVASAPPPPTPAPAVPASFANGRYQVKKFLGEGGKKRVYLAHDTLLDRDVAFALIKTEGLDAIGRERVTREAQAMGRLGAHPHIVTIFEIGEERDTPFVVTELMAGGDVEGLLEQQGGALPLPRALEIAKDVCRGLAFAHQQGIVHRDLKPGNVWLTSPLPLGDGKGKGVAKIGDFGLAVALDRSRLTQQGLMVGTVAYMPPEQALGGDVTPQADLYAFGAMLYELVTGRPPFEADDPTAVISQHINTPPVSPSWRSEHCPPELEALILRCLAKVPAERPASALEVLTALEGVDPEGRSASHTGSGANPLERLARGVFVGRERELGRLHSAFDEAFAGRGSVVMLVGEPGIGKTRTSLELETYARMRGGRAIWGRAHEAAGAPPYRPWVQAADTYATLFGIERIGASMGPQDTAELSRIFPGLRAQPGYAPPLETPDPNAARFRLFEAYLRLLRAFAGEAPLVVVLDDLHWADKPTLLLLQHLAPDLARLRVLILGTYRDTELSRTHPLSEALAELNRESGFLRIALGGLSLAEVTAYIRAAAGIEPAPALVERIHAETEGNPFFLAQVVNLMAEEGTLTRETVSDIAIPEGVKEALGRRLDRLSEDANSLLSYASVAGREFSYDTLKLISDRDDDALLRLIEEGLAARVVEETEQAGRYRFTHALMQETLLAELSTTRRVRMHGQVAEALERRYGDRAGEQAAARLALHFVESASLNEAHAEKAVLYSALAGRQAEAQAAWADAARHYEAAIAGSETSERPNADQKHLADLMTAYGRCKRIDGDPRPGWRRLLQARELYRGLGDREGFARASIETQAFLASPERLIPIAHEALDFLGQGDDPHLRATLLAALDRRQSGTEGAESLASAEVLAREHGFEDVLAEVRLTGGYRALQHGRYSEAERHFREAHQMLDRIGHYENAGFGALQHAGVLASIGDVDGAVAAFRDTLAYCRRMRVITPQRGACSWLAGVAMARGDGDLFVEAMSILESIPGNQIFLRHGRAMEALRDGDLALAWQMRPTLDLTGGIVAYISMVIGMEAEIAALRGDTETVRSALERLRAPDPGSSPRDTILCFPETLPQFGSLPMVKAAYDVLCTSHAALRLHNDGGVCVDRVRGHLALRLDSVDEADRYFRTGLEWCERERCWVEAGRCHQGLAQGAERQGDIGAARAHLDAAAALFAKYGVKLYLDQVLAKKEVLKS